MIIQQKEAKPRILEQSPESGVSSENEDEENSNEKKNFNFPPNNRPTENIPTIITPAKNTNNKPKANESSGKNENKIEKPMENPFSWEGFGGNSSQVK